MTDTLYAWSQDPEDNASADATINWAEFQTPSSVNDSARAMMARIAQFIADAAPTKTSTNSGNAYAVSSDAAGATLRNGEQITFIPSASNTSACTLNVDGRGAKAWGPAPSTSFAANNIMAGVPVTAFYRSATDEWISPGTGYYVTQMASGVALQSITARLPQIGDLVVSLAPTPGAGRIRLTESTQSILKSAYPELNSYLSGLSYPWGSTATHFSLPPAAGYFLRFAATSSSVDTGGSRSAGSTQADTNKAATIAATGLTATSLSSTTVNISGGTVGGTGGASWGSDGGGVSGPTNPTGISASASTTTTTNIGGSVSLSGGTEVRVKNIAFHCDVVASTAISAAQVAVFGFPFQWDTGTSNDDPGTGRLRGDNAALASIGTLYISATDGWGVDISDLLAGLSAGNAINLSKVGAQNNRIVATISGTPIDNTTYVAVPVTIAISSGALASGDQLALEYATGASGPTGPAGPNTGLDYAWSTSTSGDPGGGKILANNGALNSATAINISKTGRNGESLGTVIGLWDNSTSTIKGHGRAFAVEDRTKYIEFDLTGLTDNSTYWTAAISNVAAGSSPSASDVMSVTFEAKGDKGDTGVGGAGDVNGPSSATDHALARFDLTTGKLLQDSAAILDDSGNLSGVPSIVGGGTLNGFLTLQTNNNASSTIDTMRLRGNQLSVQNRAGTQSYFSIDANGQIYVAPNSSAASRGIWIGRTDTTAWFSATTLLDVTATSSASAILLDSEITNAGSGSTTDSVASRGVGRVHGATEGYSPSSGISYMRGGEFHALWADDAGHVDGVAWGIECGVHSQRAGVTRADATVALRINLGNDGWFPSGLVRAKAAIYCDGAAGAEYFYKYYDTNNSTILSTVDQTGLGFFKGGGLFNALTKVSLNAASLPTPLTGTVLQIAQADGTGTRVGHYAFGVATPSYDFIRTRGTAASPSAVQATDILGQFGWSGHDGTNYAAGLHARIVCDAAENWDSTHRGTHVKFYTTPTASTTARLVAEFGANGNIIMGAQAALATNATDGFVYVPTCAGTPTGTPTPYTGMAPIVINTTNNKLYFYSGGAWRDAGP